MSRHLVGHIAEKFWGMFWGMFWTDPIGIAHQPQPISGEHRDQPRLAVFLVRDDWRFLAAVGDRLLHRIQHVEVLNPFHFKVQSRQLRTNDIGVPRGTAVLLATEGFEKPRLAELIAPQALDTFSFLPGVHGIAEVIRPCAHFTSSSSE